MFSDPGVFFGGLFGRLLSSSTIMEPSEIICDVNLPVDRSESNTALKSDPELASAELGEGFLCCERHIPDPFAEAVGW